MSILTASAEALYRLHEEEAPCNPCAESFFLKQRAEWFVPFLCQAPAPRLTHLRESTHALKEQLAHRKGYDDLLLSQEEKTHFFNQSQRPISVYDSFITLLNNLIDSAISHPIPWLVEQHILSIYGENLVLIIRQLEEIGRGWTELIFHFCKRRELKKARDFIITLALTSCRILFDIRELKAYLTALHNAHSDKHPPQQEAI